LVKRTQRPGPPKVPRGERENKPEPPALERHSGEGSASALETLNRIESRRQFGGHSRVPEEPDDKP
jgi:hypothetical protein